MCIVDHCLTKGLGSTAGRTVKYLRGNCFSFTRWHKSPNSQGLPVAVAVPVKRLVQVLLISPLLLMQPRSQSLAGASWQLEAAVFSFSRQLLFPEKDHALVWKAAQKHAVGEALLCLIYCCTQLKEPGLGHPELGAKHDPASPQAPQSTRLLQPSHPSKGDWLDFLGSQLTLKKAFLPHCKNTKEELKKKKKLTWN